MERFRYYIFIHSRTNCHLTKLIIFFPICHLWRFLQHHCRFWWNHWQYRSDATVSSYLRVIYWQNWTKNLGQTNFFFRSSQHVVVVGGLDYFLLTILQFFPLFYKIRYNQDFLINMPNSDNPWINFKLDCIDNLSFLRKYFYSPILYLLFHFIRVII